MQRFSVLSFFLLSLFLKSQTGRISGSITDSKTGETLPGASIVIEGTIKGAAADFDGKFAINNVPVGKITLVVSYVSYVSKKLTDVIVVANDVTFINVKIDPSTSQELGEVVIEAKMVQDNAAGQVLLQKKNTS